MNSTKLVLGILGSAFIGAFIGILLAPNKGKKSGKTDSDLEFDLKDKFDDYYRKVNNHQEALLKSAKDYLVKE